MTDGVCGNCQGTWRNNRCLDCGATLGEIAAAAERPGGPAALLLNLRRHGMKDKIIHPTPEESDD